jgi:hypothetical protein
VSRRGCTLYRTARRRGPKQKWPLKTTFRGLVSLKFLRPCVRVRNVNFKWLTFYSMTMSGQGGLDKLWQIPTKINLPWGLPSCFLKGVSSPSRLPCPCNTISMDHGVATNRALTELLFILRFYATSRPLRQVGIALGDIFHPALPLPLSPCYLAVKFTGNQPNQIRCHILPIVWPPTGPMGPTLTNTASPVRDWLIIWWERFRGTRKDADRGPLNIQSSLVTTNLKHRSPFAYSP